MIADIRSANMPYLYAMTHRMEGADPVSVYEFMPLTSKPKPKAADDEAQIRAAFGFLEKQIAIGDMRQRKNGKT